MEINIQNEREKQIKEHEVKKLTLKDKLKNYVEQAEMNHSKFVIKRGACERLIKSKPAAVDLSSKVGIPFLVMDYFSKWPSFTSVLYCALDYQIVILEILLFSLFDRITGSSVISVAIIYIIEKLL